MTYEQPKSQEQQSLNPKDYHTRIIVAGTRNWFNKKMFHETLLEYLKRFDTPILFISGAAPTGADRMIIDWCKKYKYPCLECPADWDHLGRVAGFTRNSEMADMATHLLCYWDLISPGTKHMREISSNKNLIITTIAIRIET
jgi:hypothetical protein